MFQEYLCQKSNEDDAKLSYEVAHRLILKLAEYVTEKAANPVKVSRNIMINQNLPKLQSCRSCIVYDKIILDMSPLNLSKITETTTKLSKR